MNGGRKRRALVCSQSDFTTDYRIHKMSTTLAAAGYEVYFLGRSHPAHSCRASERTHIMRLLFWRSPLFYAEFNLRILTYLLFHKKYDLVVSIDLDTLLGSLVGAKLRGESILFDSHEYFPEVPEIANKRHIKLVWTKIQDICVPHVDLCVTVCQSIADIFKRKYNKDFMVVRNVPLADRAIKIEREAKNEDARGTFNILYQGAVNIGRGIEETIEALEALEDCVLTIVGDGDVMQQVRRLASERGVADRVKFEGLKPFAELAPYMAAADLGIVFMKNTSLNQYYALPNRTFDFIQAGLPILANKLPELSRIVEKEEVGMCIPEVTKEEIEKAIRQIKTAPEIRRRWHENMGKIAQQLTWEKETAQLVEILKKQQ